MPFYAIHDKTGTFSPIIVQEWSEAQKKIAEVKLATGTGPLYKKFHFQDDACYFAEWGAVKRSFPLVKPDTIVVYTDGSALMTKEGTRKAGSGVYFGENHILNVAEPLTTPPLTNNRAELYAIQRAIQIINNPINIKYFPASEHTILIYSDSSYSRDALTKWRRGWEQSNFRDGAIQNRDIIEPIWALMDTSPRTIIIEWTKGHSGVHGNERADSLANKGACLS
jgi:ribonuclease HI